MIVAILKGLEKSIRSDLCLDFPRRSPKVASAKCFPTISFRSWGVSGSDCRVSLTGVVFTVAYKCLSAYPH
jgi:hypothetical protein